MSFEEQIRERAYQIWLAGGMADGQAHEHWVSAEQAVHGEIVETSAEPEVILTKAAPKAEVQTKTVAAKPAKAKPAKAKAAAAKPAAAAPKAPRARKAKPVELTTAH